MSRSCFFMVYFRGMEHFSHDVKTAGLAAIKAGEVVLLKNFKQRKPGDYKFKKHSEIITRSDLLSDTAIKQVLKKLTPDIGVISEEDKRRTPWGECNWILDPLDGTSNYAAHLPLWGISLALACNKEVIFGLISLPIMHECYMAIKGGGAWQIIGNEHKKISVSKVKKIKDAFGLFCYGYLPEERIRGLKHVPKLSEKSRVTRRLGAAVFEAAWVASGRAEYSVLHGINSWDVAAGALLVREAGGKVTTPQGKEWKIGDRDIVFSAPGVTRELLNIFKHG